MQASDPKQVQKEQQQAASMDGKIKKVPKKKVDSSKQVAQKKEKKQTSKKTEHQDDQIIGDQKQKDKANNTKANVIKIKVIQDVKPPKNPKKMKKQPIQEIQESSADFKNPDVKEKEKLKKLNSSMKQEIEFEVQNLQVQKSLNTIKVSDLDIDIDHLQDCDGEQTKVIQPQQPNKVKKQKKQNQDTSSSKHKKGKFPERYQKDLQKQPIFDTPDESSQFSYLNLANHNPFTMEMPSQYSGQHDLSQIDQEFLQMPLLESSHISQYQQQQQHKLNNAYFSPSKQIKLIPNLNSQIYSMFQSNPNLQLTSPKSSSKRTDHLTPVQVRQIKTGTEEKLVLPKLQGATVLQTPNGARPSLQLFQRMNNNYVTNPLSSQQSGLCSPNPFQNSAISQHFGSQNQDGGLLYEQNYKQQLPILRYLQNFKSQGLSSHVSPHPDMDGSTNFDQNQRDLNSINTFMSQQRRFEAKKHPDGLQIPEFPQHFHMRRQTEIPTSETIQQELLIPQNSRKRPTNVLTRDSLVLNSQRQNLYGHQRINSNPDTESNMLAQETQQNQIFQLTEQNKSFVSSSKLQQRNKSSAPIMSGEVNYNNSALFQPIQLRDGIQDLNGSQQVPKTRVALISPEALRQFIPLYQNFHTLQDSNGRQTRQQFATALPIVQMVSPSRPDDSEQNFKSMQTMGGINLIPIMNDQNQIIFLQQYQQAIFMPSSHDVGQSISSSRPDIPQVIQMKPSTLANMQSNQEMLQKENQYEYANIFAHPGTSTYSSSNEIHQNVQTAEQLEQQVDVKVASVNKQGGNKKKNQVNKNQKSNSLQVSDQQKAPGQQDRNFFHRKQIVQHQSENQAQQLQQHYLEQNGTMQHQQNSMTPNAQRKKTLAMSPNYLTPIQGGHGRNTSHQLHMNTNYQSETENVSHMQQKQLLDENQLSMINSQLATQKPQMQQSRINSTIRKSKMLNSFHRGGQSACQSQTEKNSEIITQVSTQFISNTDKPQLKQIQTTRNIPQPVNMATLTVNKSNIVASSNTVVDEGKPVVNDKILTGHGALMRNLNSYCQRYFKTKNNQWMSGHKYKDSVSYRLKVSKETFNAKRQKLPVLILNLDGCLGYFDETKAYVIKEKSMSLLHSLSHNFRIVAFSYETKGLLKRLCKQLADQNRSFIFDAVYRIRKKHNTPYKANLSQILIDFSPEDEENLDMFICSSVVVATVDCQNIDSKPFEEADLREVCYFDRDWLRGEKSPLIIRVPHARNRPVTSNVFDALFQLLICLLIMSKQKNFETSSFFSYNERTSKIRMPNQIKDLTKQLMPEKMKNLEKYIQLSKSNRFVFGTPQYGMHLHKGFKLMSEIQLDAGKFDWIECNFRVFKPLQPLKETLRRITQHTLAQAELPSGQRMVVHCVNDEAQRRFNALLKKNENIKKHIRKYRVKYWTVNQLDEDLINTTQKQQISSADNQDKSNGLHASQEANDTNDVDKCKVAPQDSAQVESAEGTEKTGDKPKPDGSEEQKKKETKIEKEPSDSSSNSCNQDDIEDLHLGSSKGKELDRLLPMPKTKLEEEEMKEIKNNGDVESSMDGESQSDVEEEKVDVNAQPIRYKIIDIKQSEVEIIIARNRLPLKSNDPHKILRFELRKLTKSRAQVLIEVCSKKQNAMMFTTNQPQHLQGAQLLQIESQINELVAKLNEQEKKGAKENINYDF